MIELEQEKEKEEKDNFQEFYNNFQTAILLSLLENNQLTKWQFDFCVDELQKQNIYAKSQTSQKANEN